MRGDLSEYNLVLMDGQLFVIDFPQAVDFSSRVDRHSRTEEAKPLLLRDLMNLENYFARYDILLDAHGEYDRLVQRLQLS